MLFFPACYIETHSKVPYLLDNRLSGDVIHNIPQQFDAPYMQDISQFELGNIAL